jgi:hypothetical protein
MRSKQTEKILLNSLRVYEHFLSGYYPYGKVMPGKNISNPFLSHKQETPSFNVYKGSDGSYMFNDYATGEQGSVFVFVIKMKNTTYQNAVKIINQIKQ